MHGLAMQRGLQLSPSVDLNTGPSSTLAAPELPCQIQTRSSCLTPSYDTSITQLA